MHTLIMKKINKLTTKVFLRFLLKIQGLEEREIAVEDHPLLRLTKGSAINTDAGQGFLFSIGLVAADNPLKYQFCMTFIVVDNREVSGQRLDLAVFPAYTQDDMNDVYEYAVDLVAGKIDSVNLTLQRTQAKHAYSWLMELSTAGYSH